MKKTKLLIVAALALVTAGVCFSGFSAFAEYRPWDVDVKIKYGGNVWNYRLSDNLSQLSEEEIIGRQVYSGFKGKTAAVKKLMDEGFPEEAAYAYMLPCFPKLLREIEETINKDKTDASLTFEKNGKFTYKEGFNGRKTNASDLMKQMIAARGMQCTVNVPVTTLKAVTAAELRQATVKRGSFSTSYRSSGANRCHNIKLASASVCGTTVAAEKNFSFNEIVGERNAANGYKESKVIVLGEYVDGTGGGVCQVSTTLYNALLVSGINVQEARRHTLVPSYVSAGFDAMVSYGSSDLCFTNDTGSPLYIAAEINNKTLTVTVYGAANPYRIVRESVELERKPFVTKEIFDSQQYPELVYTDQTKVVRGGSDYVKSASYLCYYKGDKLIERRLIRTDVYKQVDRVIARGKLVRPETDATCG